MSDRGGEQKKNQEWFRILATRVVVDIFWNGKHKWMKRFWWGKEKVLFCFTHVKMPTRDVGRNVRKLHVCIDLVFSEVVKGIEWVKLERAYRWNKFWYHHNRTIKRDGGVTIKVGKYGVTKIKRRKNSLRRSHIFVKLCWKVE